MASFTQIGDNAGEAAPGEYGPRALLTARGDTIVRDSTGVPVRLALPAAGTFLGSDGTDLLGRKPPGYLLARDNGGAATPLNTTAETSILNSTMAGALPAFVAIGDRVNLRAWGAASFGGTGTLLFNVYAGATKIVTGSASGNYTVGSTRGWLLDLWVHLLSSTTVAVTGFMIPRGPAGAGFSGVGASTDYQIGGSDVGSAVTVSALPLAIDIKAVCSINTATTQVSCKGAEALYHPKGY